MLKQHSLDTANIPMRKVGPLKLTGPKFNAVVEVPLATLESPLWPSVGRGALVSRQVANGIQVVVLRESMTRSVLVQGPSAEVAAKVIADLRGRSEELAAQVALTSKHAKLQDWHAEVVGNLLYLRFAITAKEAAGHNMATLAAEQLLNWMLQNYSELQYVSISGNYCVDKKASAINGILGRGKHVVAEITVPCAICEKYLRSTPEAIVALNIKKNLIGTILAGGVRTANAHFANMLLAFYLATGQDAANIVEGSQGITFAEVKGDDLYFSVTLPNIIVGTVGAGKDLEYVQNNLALMGCLNVENGARRLAAIAAATVLCGELSLLAAQTNPGELIRSHVALERKS